jgi:hypothetical protein
MQEFKTPNIALQKLRTQVIVESGKTIHLGGLIAFFGQYLLLHKSIINFIRLQL